MLKALYDYAIRNELTVPPGFVKKSVKAFVSLSSDGEFLGLHLPDAKELFVSPDIGNLAQGADKCNVIIEKRSVIFPKEENAKSRFYREILKEGSEAVPDLSVCLKALEDGKTVQRICEELDNNKVKDSERVSFCVDGRVIVKDENMMPWWSEYRKKFVKNDKVSESLCLITGNPTVPLERVPAVTGLQAVGGHGKGDALICFDKKAFWSYDLQFGANAPVSEDAFAAVKAALDTLLSDSPILAGMKFVHWYSKSVEKDDDLLAGLFDNWSEDDETEEEDAVDENIARNQATELVKSVHSGERVMLDSDIQYYILMLSGVNGRVMIRRYEMGNYSELRKNIDLWYSDLELVNQYGTGNVKPHKLAGRLIRLLTKQNGDRKVFDRLSKELAGVTPAVINSIISGSQLPDTVAVRALAYIRSQMLESGDDAPDFPVPDAIACQWLKVWLLRKKRSENKEETLMTDRECIDKAYNANHPEPAYHCGAILAVYARIQKIALKDVNAGITQRYYGAASRTPAFVLGRLDVLCEHHLEKFDDEEDAEFYEKMLLKSYDALGDIVPKSLSTEQQAYFALGYRQKCSDILKLEKEREEERKKRVAKKFKEEKQKQED